MAQHQRATRRAGDLHVHHPGQRPGRRRPGASTSRPACAATRKRIEAACSRTGAGLSGRPTAGPRSAGSGPPRWPPSPPGGSCRRQGGEVDLHNARPGRRRAAAPHAAGPHPARAPAAPPPRSGHACRSAGDSGGGEVMSHFDEVRLRAEVLAGDADDLVVEGLPRSTPVPVRYSSTSTASCGGKPGPAGSAVSTCRRRLGHLIGAGARPVATEPEPATVSPPPDGRAVGGGRPPGRDRARRPGRRPRPPRAPAAAGAGGLVAARRIAAGSGWGRPSSRQPVRRRRRRSTPNCWSPRRFRPAARSPPPVPRPGRWFPTSGCRCVVAR